VGTKCHPFFNYMAVWKQSRSPLD